MGGVDSAYDVGEAFDGALAGEDDATVGAAEGAGAEQVGELGEVVGVGLVFENGNELGQKVRFWCCWRFAVTL